MIHVVAWSASFPFAHPWSSYSYSRVYIGRLGTQTLHSSHTHRIQTTVQLALLLPSLAASPPQATPHTQAMATFKTTTLVIGSVAARPPPRAHLRVARAATFRCAYSKEGLKACSAMKLSPAALKGMGLRRVSRPWGSKLVEERIDDDDTRLVRLSRALNPEWVLACVVGYGLFNPRRLRR